ncbi:hypothetical protein HOA97_04175 [bacterium]|jgi:hypothetical protein|nr:hypothetical protein [bacterium]
MKKLYLIDWGKDRRGSRFAITSAENSKDLYHSVDYVGDASEVRAIEINNGHGPFCESPFYIELPSMTDNGLIEGYNSNPKWSEKVNKDSYPDYTDEELEKPDCYSILSHKTGWFAV